MELLLISKNLMTGAKDVAVVVAVEAVVDVAVVVVVVVAIITDRGAVRPKSTTYSEKVISPHSDPITYF